MDNTIHLTKEDLYTVAKAGENDYVLRHKGEPYPTSSSHATALIWNSERKEVSGPKLIIVWLKWLNLKLTDDTSFPGFPEEGLDLALPSYEEVYSSPPPREDTEDDDIDEIPDDEERYAKVKTIPGYEGDENVATEELGDGEPDEPVPGATRELKTSPEVNEAFNKMMTAADYDAAYENLWKVDFVEDKHPRADDGKFAPKGEGGTGGAAIPTGGMKRKKMERPVPPEIARDLPRKMKRATKPVEPPKPEPEPEPEPAKPERAPGAKQPWEHMPDEWRAETKPWKLTRDVAWHEETTGTRHPIDYVAGWISKPENQKQYTEDVKNYGNAAAGHRAAVRRALAEGEKVPPEVVAALPGLLDKPEPPVPPKPEPKPEPAPKKAAPKKEPARKYHTFAKSSEAHPIHADFHDHPTWRNWLSGLSSKEHSAIRAYVGEKGEGYVAGAEEANRLLRKGRYDPSDTTSEYGRMISGLDTAIEKSALHKDMTLYRGAPSSSPARYEAVADGSLKVGDKLRDDGFTSTSPRWGTATLPRFFNPPGKPYPILYRIKAKAGTKGAYLSFDELGNPYMDQSEFLIHRGNEMTIEKMGYEEINGKRTAVYDLSI